MLKGHAAAIFEILGFCSMQTAALAVSLLSRHARPVLYTDMRCSYCAVKLSIRFKSTTSDYTYLFTTDSCTEERAASRWSCAICASGYAAANGGSNTPHQQCTCYATHTDGTEPTTGDYVMPGDALRCMSQLQVVFMHSPNAFWHPLLFLMAISRKSSERFAIHSPTCSLICTSRTHPGSALSARRCVPVWRPAGKTSIDPCRQPS